MKQKLKAPFPWAGGKSKVAEVVWGRIGNVANYIEPFAGSLAVMLLRPDPPNIETVGDLDHMVANFWRATQRDPEAVVEHANWPVNEIQIHANHRWLVLSDDAKAFRAAMRSDPEYFDPKVAGRWVHGLCAWIGSGWCNDPDEGPTKEAPGGSGNKRPELAGGSQMGHGIHAKGTGADQKKRPSLGNKKGVHSLSDQIPNLGVGRESGLGLGVHAKGGLSEQLPRLVSFDGVPGVGMDADADDGKIPMISHPGGGVGMNPHPAAGIMTEGRPQLADAGGVHSNGKAETCAQRRAWLLDWFQRLRNRLRTVRVCCGDWSRICSSESTTTRLGITGVFLDPPYGYVSGRAKKLYAQDSGTVASEVRTWCLENGPRDDMRIALCGYDNEGHEILEAAGWSVVAYEAAGGYGNRTEKGRANRKRERIWFSPGCLNTQTLWDLVPTEY